VALRLRVVTPASPVVDSEVDTVVCPGSEGQFGVLPGHEPFLAPLAQGTVEWQASGRRQRVAIGGGFAQVTADAVVVLADSASAQE
jgi:F-type H+-transporting ATPase subunit epsilon